jgi:hypothetical protein
MHHSRAHVEVGRKMALRAEVGPRPVSMRRSASGHRALRRRVSEI